MPNNDHCTRMPFVSKRRPNNELLFIKFGTIAELANGNRSGRRGRSDGAPSISFLYLFRYGETFACGGVALEKYARAAKRKE